METGPVGKKSFYGARRSHRFEFQPQVAEVENGWDSRKAATDGEATKVLPCWIGNLPFSMAH